MAKIESLLPSYEKMTVILSRTFRYSWALIVVAVVSIIVSNYIHEIQSLATEEKEKNICKGLPEQRIKEDQGHMCTQLEKSLVVRKNASKRSLLDVFCRAGKTPFIHQFFSTGILDIRCETDDFEILSGSNATEISKEFSRMWGLKLINYPAFLKSRHRLSPFNDTCKGLVHKDTCWVAYSFHSLDVQLVAIFFMGIFLFLTADNLSRNTALYYSSGIGMGVFMSLLIIMLVFSRFMYKRGGFVLAMAFGWSGLVYCLTQLYANVETIYNTYQTYIIAYVFVMSLFSFFFCYWWGPPSSARTLDIVRWTVQMLGLALMFQSSHLPPFYRMSAVLLVFTAYFFPLKSLLKSLRSNYFFYRLFPPKPKLLSEEEYLRQGNESTRKALEQLREYCKSPDCNAWKTISRVKTPQRLASFVTGDSHLSDDEVLEYDNDPRPELTDDEDLSDADLHFELN